MDDREQQRRHDQGKRRAHPAFQSPQGQPTVEDLLHDRCTDDHDEYKKYHTGPGGLLDKVAGRFGDIQVVDKEHERQVEERDGHNLGTDADQ